MSEKGVAGTYEQELMVIDDIQSQIYTIRGVQVMLDVDMAEFYGIGIKRLNEQVKRNIERFPEEFMFQLSKEEYNLLRSQNATLEKGGSLRSQIATMESGRGKNRKYLPYAFTEQGVAMLAGVLRSEIAVRMSIQKSTHSSQCGDSFLPTPKCFRD